MTLKFVATTDQTQAAADKKTSNENGLPSVPQIKITESDVITAPKDRLSELNQEIKATKKAFEYTAKTGNKNLRISAITEKAQEPFKPVSESIKQGPGLQIRATRQESEGAAPALELEDEAVLMLKPANEVIEKDPLLRRMMGQGGVFLTIFWLGYCFTHLVMAYGLSGIFGMSPQDLGGNLAGMLAPVALFWVIMSHLQRGMDIQRYAEALRSELQAIIFPTEDRARRVGKDIERLCQQAAELSSASRSVIKAIARARQGLRVEIRDFVGVSKKAEFHIDRLADTLHERAARIVALTEEIEQRVSHIGDTSQAGVKAWDEATATIVGRATEMENAMGAGADKVLAAAAMAGERTKDIEKNIETSVENLSGSIDRVAARLSGLSTRFDEHTKGLADAAGHVSDETKKLSATIEEQIRNLGSVTDKTLEAMTRSGQTIQEHRTALDKGAAEVARQADHIASTISVSLEGLNDAASAMMARTGEIETRIAAQADRLHVTTGSLTRQAETIEEAGLSAANKLGEAMGVALTGAESISSAVRRAIEQLEKSTESAKKQADTLIEATTTNITELNRAGEGNVEHIKSIVSMLEKSREQIEAASAIADRQVQKLSEAVETQSQKINMSTVSMVERIESVQTSLESPLRSLSSAVTDADTCHQQIEETLRRRVSDLNESSEKARESAEQIRSILRGQAQEISTLAGQIGGHARTINEQMVEQKDVLNSDVRESLRSVEQVREALERQASRLSELSENAVLEVVRLDKQIASRCDEIGAATRRTLTDMRQLDESLEGRVTALKDRSETATDSLQSVMKALDQTAGGFEPVFSSAIERAAQAQQRFEILHAGFSSSTESNLENLKKIGIVFDERLTSLRRGAEQAADILQSSSAGLQERVEDIERAAQSASDKMHSIEQALENQSSDIHLITDQALLKIENIQKSINEQFHELSESVGQAIAQIGNVGQELGHSADHVDTVAGRIITRFDEVGTAARRESEGLSGAAAQSVDMTKALVAQVQMEADNLLKTSRDTLIELKRAGDGFAMKAKEVAEYMNASLTTSRTYGEELRKQSAVVAEASVESADRISKASSLLSSRLDDIGSTASAVVARIGKSRDDLADEASRLLSVSSATVKAADDATATFSRQSNALFKAVQDAATHVDKIRKEEGRVQREAFMSSAKFIVESLHSLSVDFTRMLEGEIPEKTWKAFQKGDISAFTRRLAELGSDLPVDKIRDKFASDSEFRTYVQRFLRQFEEMYDQAVANDHGDLLGATFASSAVGKLYQILCAAAGREPRTGQSGRDDRRVV